MCHLEASVHQHNTNININLIKKHYEEALRLNPNNGRIYHCLAILHSEDLKDNIILNISFKSYIRQNSTYNLCILN